MRRSLGALSFVTISNCIRLSPSGKQNAPKNWKFPFTLLPVILVGDLILVGGLVVDSRAFDASEHTNIETHAKKQLTTRTVLVIAETWKIVN